MKKSIYKILLVILNILIFGLLFYVITFSFFIVVADLGEFRGKIIANEISKEQILFIIIGGLISLFINYFFFKKLIILSKPFLSGFILTLIGVSSMFLTLVITRNNFIKQQIIVTKMHNYIDFNVKEIKIERLKDLTQIKIKQIDSIEKFSSEIGFAKRQIGIFKYQKKYRVIINNKDTILTNGSLYGPFEQVYFSTDKDYLNKYFEKLK